MLNENQDKTDFHTEISLFYGCIYRAFSVQCWWWFKVEMREEGLSEANTAYP